MRWIIVAVLAFVAYKLLGNKYKNRLAKQEKQSRASAAAKEATGEMVKDPVCGTYVETDSSLSVRDGETVHRFCSYECRDIFLRRLQQHGGAAPGEKKD